MKTDEEFEKEVENENRSEFQKQIVLQVVRNKGVGAPPRELVEYSARIADEMLAANPEVFKARRPFFGPRPFGLF